MKRCDWVNSNILETQYHDNEWGIPVHDDRLLFEMLILESAQAGLSWNTILKKRKGYLNAFDNFDIHKIAKYTDKKINELLKNTEIIRHKQKIVATIENAKQFLIIQDKYESFDSYIWSFVDGKSIINSWQKSSDIPTSTLISKSMSQDLKKRGFKFVALLFAMLICKP